MLPSRLGSRPIQPNEAALTDTPRPVHYVLSTHWDREWREPFQALRFDLVRLLDEVLDGFAEGRLHTPFVTDGQSSIIDDYLAIRPDRRAEVEALARSGRFDVGPWHTMPDEFLVSGESLVRNLELGRRRARALGGEASVAGLVCDMFGHNSQLPQIFAGFGISAGFIWRGVNAEGVRNLLWVGADGTELPCHRFGPHGYGSYAFIVRRGYDYGGEVPDPLWLDRYLEAEAEATTVLPVLAMDTCDHQHWDEPAYRRLLERMPKLPAFELHHSSLSDYAKAMAEDFEADVTMRGELREPGRQRYRADKMSLDGDEQWVIPGVASSRVYLKQGYTLAETTLLRWAEPFAAIATSELRVTYAPALFELAWERLIENQAHDSIGGCSVDEVHRDMEHRNDEALAIARKVTHDALSQLAANIEGRLEMNELRVVVFNSVPRVVEDVVEFELPLPVAWPQFQEFFGYERKHGFRIFDQWDNELVYQRLAERPGLKRQRIRPTRLLEEVSYDAVTVALPISLPPLGYTTLTVRAASAEDPFPRHPAVPGIATSDRSMSNGLLSATIEPNGSVTLVDLQTGSRFDRLLTFEDSADIGDGWFHGQAVNDEVVTSAATAASVRLVNDGPLVSRFRIQQQLHVPDRFDAGLHRRSDTTVQLELDTLLTLRAGSDMLEVQTAVKNTASDHRLRVLLPTGCAATSYFADAPYDVVERQVALRRDNHSYRELEVETRPQESWTAVVEGARGLAVVAPGLKETAVCDLPTQPIALTLYRSTQRTAFSFVQPEGQMLDRRLCFTFGVLPLRGDPDRIRLAEKAQLLMSPLSVLAHEEEDLAILRARGDLSAERSYLEVQGSILVASLRQVDRGIVELRLTNPNATSENATIRLTLGAPVASLVETNFEGQPCSEPRGIDPDGLISVTLAPKQVKTIRLTMAPS